MIEESCNICIDVEEVREAIKKHIESLGYEIKGIYFLHGIEYDGSFGDPGTTVLKGANIHVKNSINKT